MINLTNINIRKQQSFMVSQLEKAFGKNDKKEDTKNRDEKKNLIKCKCGKMLKKGTLKCPDCGMKIEKPITQ